MDEEKRESVGERGKTNRGRTCQTAGRHSADVVDVFAHVTQPRADADAAAASAAATSYAARSAWTLSRARLATILGLLLISSALALNCRSCTDAAFIYGALNESHIYYTDTGLTMGTG